MNFSDLTEYLHQYRRDEVPGLVVGYSKEKKVGISSKEIGDFNSTSMYSVRPPFNAANPNNGLIEEIPFYIAKNGRLNENPAHFQEYYEAIYVLEGSLTHEVNGAVVIQKPGTLLILTGGVYHKIHTCGHEDIAVSIFIDEKMLIPKFYQRISPLQMVGPMFQKHAPSDYLLIDFGVESTTDIYGKLMLCSYFDPSAHSDQSTELLLLLFFTEADSTLLQQSRPAKLGIDAQLDQISRYIQSNCAAVTLEETAKQFGYAPSYLSTTIRQEFGMSFTRFRNHHRILMAAALLCGTERSIIEIAAEVGILTLSHFYQLFEKEFHLTPSAYREKYGVHSQKAEIKK